MSNQRSLVIADLHLSPERPDITAAFLHFLRIEAPKTDALYILGDLFEVWIGDDNPSPLLGVVADALQQLKAQKVPVFFCHGNRDFLLKQAYANRAGMQLLAPSTVVDLYGKPTLLMHGDSLCTLDLQYQKFRQWWSQPWWQWLVLHTPLWYRQHLAGKARRISAQDKKGKTSMIMDVTPDEVPKIMQQFKVSHLIHGHTHRPAIHNLALASGQSAQRFVVGDWYHQQSFLEITPQAWTLHAAPLAAQLGAQPDNAAQPLA